MYEYALAARGQFTLYSGKDPAGANTQPYLPAGVCRGFGKPGLSFIVQSVREGIKSTVVVLAGTRMLWPGYLIKLLAPKTRVVLFTHGTEKWEALSPAHKKMLGRIDFIIANSYRIKEKMEQLFYIPGEKFELVDHCFDPFLPEPANRSRRDEFRSTYGFTENDLVLLTIRRVSAMDTLKGYEKIMHAIKKLNPAFPHLKYLFAGKYDEEEKKQLVKLVHALGIEYEVTFAGFVPDSVIGDYYNMADAFIVPGETEGFGMSFIEALYFNKPVITGGHKGIGANDENARLGTRVDFNNLEEVTGAIQKVVTNINAFKPDHKLAMEKFSYPVYKNALGQLLDRCIT